MALPLSRIVTTLESLAPPSLAATWDNVGLLLEPAPGHEREISRALLTIDLGEPELDEALAAGCELVVAYHPPIFRPLKRLTCGDPTSRVVLRAATSALAIYSPHTALDAVSDGVNDWLLGAFGPSPREARAIEPASGGGGSSPATTMLEPPTGAGRFARLEPPLDLANAVARIKAHLGLSHVRVAAAPRHQAGEPLVSVAVCPGAGGSLFAGLGDVALLLTGEMRHHDVRARNAAGTSVVLCDHTNTERGFLPILADRLRTQCDGQVEWLVSARDRDPLCVV